MNKRKDLWCFDCGKRTVHNYVCSEKMGEDAGILRPFIAVCTMGWSEVPVSRTYECSKCGRIKRI